MAVQMITKNVNVVSTMDLFLLVDSHNRSLAIGVPPLRFSTSEGLNCTSPSRIRLQHCARSSLRGTLNLKE